MSLSEPIPADIELSIDKRDKDILLVNGFPQMPEIQGIAFMGLTTIIMGLGALIPVLPLLVFYGLWGSQILYKGRFVLKPSPALFFLAIFVTLCLFSSLWSYDPLRSLYNAALFAAMLFCIAIASRIISVPSFVKGVAVGTFVVLMVTLLSGKYSTVYATGKPALIGFFGSKNVTGQLASIGAITSVIWCLWAQDLKHKLAVFLMVCVSCLCLYLSTSITSMLSTMATLGLLFAFYILSKFPAGLRGYILVLSILGAISIALLMSVFEIDVIGKILDAFHKDRGLTGRTWLWSEALTFVLDKPIQGYGYHGFWVSNNPNALRLWDLSQFEKKESGGFHFHNLYIQTIIDIGVFGLLMMLFMVLGTLIKSTFLMLNGKMDIAKAAFFCLLLIFVVRSLTEVDLLGPNGSGTLVFYFLFLKIMTKQT